MSSDLHRAAPAEIADRIRVLRGQRVLLDSDLATLYGVTTRRLNEQIRRNRARFPADFVLQLDFNELRRSWSQIATSSKKFRGPKRLPLAFTEHGAIMAAMVLNSARAVEMSVYSYDDPQSIRAKADYVRDKGLGGMMFWELSQDRNDELIDVIVESLRPAAASSLNETGIRSSYH